MGQAQITWMKCRIVSIKMANMEIIQLLLDHGADVNYETIYGQKALYESIIYSRMEVTELLLQYGADEYRKRSHISKETN
ncbi:hypothetical protein Trydic_g22065 [Trypoxylus dichotomus]